MADLMDLYGGLGPGTGAMFAGQNQANSDMNSQMQRNMQQAHIQDTLARLSMAQELQPHQIGQMDATTANTQALTQGHTFDNQVNQNVGADVMAQGRAEDIKGKTSAGALQRQKNFFNDLSNGADLEESIKKHSLDPKASQADQLRSMTPEARQAMAKATYQHMIQNDPKFLEDKLKEDLKAQREEKVHGIDNASRERIMKMSIEAGRYNRSNTPRSFEEGLNKAKTAPEKLAVVMQERARRIQDASIGDGEARLAAAKELDTYINMLKPLAIADLSRMRQDGQIDERQFGLKVKQLEDIGGPQIEINPTSGQPQPGAQPPQGQPPAGQPPAQQTKPQGPPPQAIQMLKSNPALKAQFDEWYGPGASDRALAQP